MGLNILQISDVHLCGEKAPSVDDLLLEITFPNGAPDIILVTGDLFDCNAFIDKNENEIKRSITEGTAFCLDLINRINSYYGSSLDESSMLFVPGNHEVLRSATNKTEYLSIYKAFLDSFYNDILPDCYTDDLSYVKLIEDKRIILIGLVSPHFDEKNIGKSTKKYDDYGLVDSTQLGGIRTKLNKIENKDEYAIVVSLHHHFILMEERDKSKSDNSYLRNCEQFLGFLSREPVCAVLHGHKHINSNRRLNIAQSIKQPERVITVLGCGSLAESDYENVYNYITVFSPGGKYELEYSSYARINAGYTMSDKPIKLPLDTSKKSYIAFKDIINDYPDLQKAYQEMLSYDIITDYNDLFRLLNNTIFSLDKVANQIQGNPDLLYFILATAHYCFLNSQKAEKSIIDKVDAFINPLLEKYSLEDVLSTTLKANNADAYTALIQNNLSQLNIKQKEIVVFSALVTQIVGFYLTIKFHCKEYYDAVVCKQIDFTYSGNNLTSEVRGNTVEFSINEDRRLLEIGVSCDTAEAIKICSLIIKEFEKTLHHFERTFSDYGFKIYYVLPKLNHHHRLTSELDSRQFSAYIPLLLPLLAGRNIYSTQEAFTRELIQNSIDAINVRKGNDPYFTEEAEIRINIGKDSKSNLYYFEIEDNGSGMTKYILERYLTTLGLSYYNSADYKTLKSQHEAISQFGIGFLSCFMLGKHVEVYTKHYSSEIGYYMDIPNYDGCFFIEEDHSIHTVGTLIRIWENPEQRATDSAFSILKIEKYMNHFIRSIDINIYVNGELKFPKDMLRKQIRKRTSFYNIYHFIPLEKDPLSGIWKADITVTRKNGFGLHFYKDDKSIYSRCSNEITLLNNGILVPLLDSNKSTQAAKNNKDLDKIKTTINYWGSYYYDVIANFPPETMNLSVSRDSLINFTEKIDLESIKDAFITFRKNLQRSSAPYNLMSKMYNTERFKEQFLTFDFKCENDSGIITLMVDRSSSGCNPKTFISFLNYISGGSFDKNAKDIPFSILDCNLEEHSFTFEIASVLYSIVSSISADCSKRIKIDVQDNKMDNNYLYLKSENRNPLPLECKHLANVIYNIQDTFSEKSDKEKDNLISQIDPVKSYFDNVRRDIRNEFEEKFRLEWNEKQIQRDLTLSLHSFLIRCLHHAYELILPNNKINLIDIAGITVGSIYALIDLACVMVPLNELESGVSIAFKRNELEPSKTWIKSLLTE